MTPPDSASSTKPFGPSARRDQLTAVAICAVIAVSLLLAWRPPSDASRERTAELAAAAVMQSETSEGFNREFDLNTAMRLAGEQGPADLESFYFFAFTDEMPAAQEIGELADKLLQAAQEHDYLGISGPDPERNRQNLLGALAARRDEDLRSAVLIYLGPASQEAEMASAAAAAGIELRYIVYPVPKPAI